MDIRTAVETIPILQAANPASLAALMPYATLRRADKGTLLFLDRDTVLPVYFLVKGTAALYKLSDNQDKKVIFIYGSGAMLNEEFLDEKPASASCELLTDSLILCFERQRFLFICQQDFGLTKAVMDSMALKIRRLYRQMKNTSNAIRGDRRLASKLWKLSVDHGIPCERGIKIGFNLTITYLADLLGFKRETVSRHLKFLTDRNLVVIERNRFIIPDRDKLKAYFDES